MHMAIFTWCSLERFVSFFVPVHISAMLQLYFYLVHLRNVFSFFALLSVSAMSQLYGYGKSEMSQMLRQRKSEIILHKFLMLLGTLSGKVTLPFLFSPAFSIGDNSYWKYFAPPGAKSLF